MATLRAHVVLPAPLAAEIDRLVGKRRRSRFLSETASREVRRLRALEALERATGAWKERNHPELRRGAAAWIRKLRHQDEQRYRKQAGR